MKNILVYTVSVAVLAFIAQFLYNGIIARNISVFVPVSYGAFLSLVVVLDLGRRVYND